MLLEVGWDQLSLRAIATRAGVSRASMSRRWPSKAHLVLGSILGATPDLTPFEGTDRDGWIRWVVEGSAQLFSRPEVRAASPGLLAALRDHDDLRNELWRGFSGPSTQLFLQNAEDPESALLDAKAVLAEMRSFAPQWLEGCAVRECFFEPTFHKHAHSLCNALMIHAEGAFYDHYAFRPWRLQALAFKAIRTRYPGYPIWRDFPYEYEFERLAIDVINGGPALREWVDDAAALPGDLEAAAGADEAAWAETIRPFLLYA